MSDKLLISNAFQTFLTEAPEYHKVWMETVQKWGAASQLDRKTETLSYLSVLAVLRLEGGLPFHVKQAKAAGATREEVISAILVGLPAAGNVVIQSLPIALNAYDQD
ncbi:carboxymuconolactone decarboxylase family protein [Pelosinus propionicus]|uniref:Uncharacterized conserved protein YurZ, alkylhydroperoxidase/carboxymuconolactone decarboxylase family n=1 Tax=Pelosinus propionicus DSM 13327 TaxID=1123291 RepID=A0A1I4NB04_9FIRM|nr:carboxymuconolactone decarboxylase family protein [Pelosinus propionicus]SFM12678.1 Uncharacterized conserved protein YurZ, alkylhydroperoxidase/carboxymuconolactone decarboxylase family [Pelosinus propionicus DSM 13327]